MQREITQPFVRGHGARLLRALWQCEAGNALYATMLLIPVGLGIIGAGADGLVWLQAKDALHKAAFEAAKAAYAAHETGDDLEDAAETILSAGTGHYGEVQSLSVSIATDAGRKAADIAVSTRLILPITSKLLGFAMTIETHAASDEDTTASKMAGVRSPDVLESETTAPETAEDSEQAVAGSSGATSESGVAQSQVAHHSPIVVTESRDRFAPEILRNSKAPGKMTD